MQNLKNFLSLYSIMAMFVILLLTNILGISQLVIFLVVTFSFSVIFLLIYAFVREVIQKKPFYNKEITFLDEHSGFIGIVTLSNIIMIIILFT